MKKFKFAAIALSALLAVIPLSACKDNGNGDGDNVNETVRPDYGTLNINNINNLKVGQSANISPRFSVQAYASEISYTFDGNDIEITGNKVKALNGDKTVTVKAKTQYHECTFTVSTLSYYGTAEVPTVTCWKGYPASFLSVNFTGQPEEYNLQYDESKITIDKSAGTVTANATGTYQVLLTSEHYETLFNVVCKEVDKTLSKWTPPTDRETYKNLLKERYQRDGNGETTLFIGDSFFDTRWFWTNFHSEYFSGKNALCHGIGGANTYDWENWTESYLAEIPDNKKPANIVVNLGTNNIGDVRDNDSLTAEGLQRLFTLMHHRLPDTKIYYFSIVNRGDVGSASSYIPSVNEKMSSWCAGLDWITFIDIYNKVTFANLNDDRLHPNSSGYDIYKEALLKTDIVIKSKN